MLDLIAPHRSGELVGDEEIEVAGGGVEVAAGGGAEEFEPADLVPPAEGLELAPDDRYLGLLADVEQLFGRNVDLVDITAARNPYFIAEALKHRVPVYGA